MCWVYVGSVQAYMQLLSQLLLLLGACMLETCLHTLCTLALYTCNTCKMNVHMHSTWMLNAFSLIFGRLGLHHLHPRQTKLHVCSAHVDFIGWAKVYEAFDWLLFCSCATHTWCTWDAHVLGWSGLVWSVLKVYMILCYILYNMADFFWIIFSQLAKTTIFYYIERYLYPDFLFVSPLLYWLFLFFRIKEESLFNRKNCLQFH